VKRRAENKRGHTDDKRILPEKGGVRDVRRRAAGSNASGGGRTKAAKSPLDVEEVLYFAVFGMRVLE